MNPFKRILVVAIAAAALLSVTEKAHSQTAVTILTTSTNAVAQSATSAVTSGTFWIKQDGGFAVQPTFSLAGAGTSSVTFNFALSLDGTTWTTTTPLTATIAANGTNTVTGYALFGPSTVDHARYARLMTVGNANSQAVTISDIRVSRRTSD